MNGSKSQTKSATPPTTLVPADAAFAGSAATLANPKGTRDYLPEDQQYRARVIRTLEDTFALYGYQPTETPILNRFDLLASKYAGGAEILKEIYRLTDQGGRELALRYDLTVPFARVMGMNPDRPLPFRRYEIGRVFRDGPVKAGRNREFTQCDVDVAGIASVMAEAELMEMAVRVYAQLQMDVVVRYGNRKWLQGLIEAAGTAPGLVPAMLTALDKLDKAGWDAVLSEMAEAGAPETVRERLRAWFELDRMTLLERMPADLPAYVLYLLQEGGQELDALETALAALGVRELMCFTPSLARGLDIYTGTVWEVFMRSGPITSSVGAGGRYDRIIGAFLRNGREYPAVGMTFGLDVMYAVLASKAGDVAASNEVTVLPIGTDLACLALVQAIRKAGVPAVMEMGGRSLRQAMRDASRRGSPFVVLVGEDERNAGRAMVRDMRTGAQDGVPLAEVPGWLTDKGCTGQG